MNKEQISELKNKLEKSKKSLEEMLGEFARKNKSTDQEQDWETVYPKSDRVNIEEKADEVEEYSSLLPVEHALEVKLKKINEALKKISEGSYGECEKCQKKISYKELLITPETKNCKDCQ